VPFCNGKISGRRNSTMWLCACWYRCSAHVSTLPPSFMCRCHSFASWFFFAGWKESTLSGWLGWALESFQGIFMVLLNQQNYCRLVGGWARHIILQLTTCIGMHEKHEQEYIYGFMQPDRFLCNDVNRKKKEFLLKNFYFRHANWLSVGRNGYYWTFFTDSKWEFVWFVVN